MILQKYTEIKQSKILSSKTLHLWPWFDKKKMFTSFIKILLKIQLKNCLSPSYKYLKVPHLGWELRTKDLIEPLWQNLIVIQMLWYGHKHFFTLLSTHIDYNDYQHPISSLPHPSLYTAPTTRWFWRPCLEFPHHPHPETGPVMNYMHIYRFIAVKKNVQRTHAFCVCPTAI